MDDPVDNCKASRLLAQRLKRGELRQGFFAIRQSRAPTVFRLRTELGLTAEQFADAYGVPVSLQDQWEQQNVPLPEPFEIYLWLIARHPTLVRDEIAQLLAGKSEAASR